MEPRRRFRFLKALSEGSFGKVYLAEMVTGDNFSTVVAIKLLHGKWLGHEEIVMRSRDEARLLGLLRHQNIIRVEDLSSINGQCAVIMEYLEGVDLKTMSTFLTEKGDLFPRRASMEIGGAIASALDAAYNHKPIQGGKPLRVIHRDIKPSNVMITAAGEVKVLDFGTARANFEDREAKTQALAFGSQAYMAPERMMGDPDTPAADIFSLGVTLWEILSGERFGKIYIREPRYQTALEQRVAGLDLSMLNAELGEQLREALRQMMDYDGSARPTACEVVEKMEELSEKAQDIGLRRLCRQYVLDAMASRGPGEAVDDPLTGTTLVEDRSSAFVRTGGQHTWSDESGESPGSSDSLAPPPTPSSEGSSGSWLQDANVAPLEEPAQDPDLTEPPGNLAPAAPIAPADGARDSTPPEVREGEPRAGLTEGVPDGGTTLVPDHELGTAAAEESTGEPGGALTTFDIPPDLEAASESQIRDDRSPEAAPVGTSQDAVGRGVEGSAPAVPAPELPPDGATWDGGDAGARIAGPVATPAAPASCTTPTLRPPVPPPEPAAVPPHGGMDYGQSSQSSAGKSGKIGLVLAALGMLGAVVIGGGAVTWFVLLRDPDPVPAPRVVPDPVVEPPPDEVTPPSAPVESDQIGNVVLRLEPNGGGTVSITSALRFKETWNGVGERAFNKIPAGTYRTKIDTPKGQVRATFDVVQDKTCTYLFDLAAGADEWRSEGCL